MITEKEAIYVISGIMILGLTYLGIYLIINIISNNKKQINEKHYPNNKYSSYTKPTQYYPYEKKLLLSKAEYTFYNILKRKCDENNLLICPKVRMEDFLVVTDKKNKLKYRGYIRSRHIDFMICNSKLYLLAGIELDDNSHKKPDIAEVDELKDNIFKAIKLPLFRVKMSQGMYENQIDNIIKAINSIPAREKLQTKTAAGENLHT